VDIWSLGCICFVLLYGTFPFYEDPRDTGNDLRDKVIRGRFTFPADGEHKNLPISPEARDLISRAMVVDPVKRLGVDGFLAHPWMQMRPRLPPPYRSTSSSTSTGDNSSLASTASHHPTTAPLLSPLPDIWQPPSCATKEAAASPLVYVNNSRHAPTATEVDPAAMVTIPLNYRESTTSTVYRANSASRVSGQFVASGEEDDEGAAHSRSSHSLATPAAAPGTGGGEGGAGESTAGSARRRIRDLFNTLIRVERARDDPSNFDVEGGQLAGRRGVKLSDLLPSKIMQKRKQHRGSSGLRIETRQLSSPRTSIGI